MTDFVLFVLLSITFSAPLLKQSAMKMFVVFTVCLSVVVLASAQADQKLKNCNEVRTAYSSKGFNVNDVPNKGVHGELRLFYLPKIVFDSFSRKFSLSSLCKYTIGHA